MTERETLRLKILEILVPTSARIGIEKVQLLGQDGIAEQFYNFVVKPHDEKAKETHRESGSQKPK